MASLMQKKKELSNFSYLGPTVKYAEKSLVIKVKKGKDEPTDNIEATGGESNLQVKDLKQTDDKESYSYYNPSVGPVSSFNEAEIFINPDEEAFEEPLF